MIGGVTFTRKGITLDSIGLQQGRGQEEKFCDPDKIYDNNLKKCVTR